MIFSQLVDRCGSTNDLARVAAIAGAAHGSWFSARIQDQGRGRLGRSWLSFEGNLFLSMIVRIKRRDLWTWIPIAAGVAAREAIADMRPSLEVRLKWPNDLWIRTASGFAKAGGILCEGDMGSGDPYVVVGVGINCRVAPQEIDQPAACCEIEDLDRFRGAVVERLLKIFGKLNVHGPDAIRAQYDQDALFQAQSEVDWGSGHGLVLGLGQAGELRVWDEATQLERGLLAEDVHLKVKVRAVCGSLA